MEGISSWIAGISAVVLMSSVISVVVPKNTAGRVVSMIGGIMVITALVSPFMDSGASGIITIGKAYEESIEKSVRKASERTDEIKNDIIERKLCSYVLEKAKTEESKCRLSLEIRGGMPVGADIICEDEEVSERVKDILQKEFGLPRESSENENEGSQ